jgi:hypothetical protein
VRSKEALMQPHMTVIDQVQFEQTQIAQLRIAIKQQMPKIRESQVEKRINSRQGKSSPGEIRTLVNGSKGHYAWPLHHRALKYVDLCLSYFFD